VYCLQALQVSSSALLCISAPSLDMNASSMYATTGLSPVNRPIVMQLEGLLRPEDKPTELQGDDSGMSLEDKMGLWNRDDGQRSTIGDDGDNEHFEGVEDFEDEDDTFEQESTGPSEYILHSEAYQWLLLTLTRESSLTTCLGDQRTTIYQKVLRRLPSGTISKHRAPQLHEIQLSIALPSMGSFGDAVRSSGPLADFVVLVSPATGASQAVSVGQYVRQIWDSDASELLATMQAWGNPSAVGYRHDFHQASGETTKYLLGCSVSRTKVECQSWLEKRAFSSLSVYLGYT
jgi:hypothetical protein